MQKYYARIIFFFIFDKVLIFVILKENQIVNTKNI